MYDSISPYGFIIQYVTWVVNCEICKKQGIFVYFYVQIAYCMTVPSILTSFFMEITPI